MKMLLSALAALGGCGVTVASPTHAPEVRCVRIWDAESAPDFAPGVVDFQRHGDVGRWVLLADGGTIGWSRAEDSAVYGNVNCLVGR